MIELPSGTFSSWD